jgi:protein O-mannosyl-transferase
MPSPRRSFSLIVAILLLIGLTALVYWPALKSEFIYDSRSQVLVDSFIHDPGNLPAVLTFRVLGMDVLDNARPVHLLSLMLDGMLWGKSSFGFHLTNLLLHLANTLFLFFFLRAHIQRAQTPQGDPRTGGHGINQTVAAGLASLFFALHPVHSEVICEVSYREDLLALFFILAALLVLPQCIQPSRFRWIWLGLALLCMIGSPASKENGYVLPILLALYTVFFFKRPKDEKRDLVWPVTLVFGFFLVGLLFYIRFSLSPSVSTITPHPPRQLDGSLWNTLLVEPRILAFLLGKIVWPAGLSPDYGPYSIRNYSLLISSVTIGSVILFQIYLARKSLSACFGFIWFWLGLLPVLNLVPIHKPLADRFLYLPMAGLGLIIAWGLLRVVSSNSVAKGLSIGGCFILALMMGNATHRQAKIWMKRETLWREAQKVNPWSPTILDNLGFAFYDIGDVEKAMLAWKQAIRVSENKDPDPWAGLALGYEALGMRREAEDALIIAVKQDSRYLEPDRLVQALIWEPGQAAALMPIVERVRERLRRGEG